MNPDRWNQIEQLYHAAREQNPDEWDGFLKQACGADEELRRELESLLGYETETAMLLDRPALLVAARALALDQRSRMIGRTLGHYRVESWLGAGGMGEVYRATDTRLDRTVAVKVLSEHLSTHPDALARFEIEAKAAAALSHPNILAIHDFGDEHETAYAVTELLHGETLRARLTRSPLELQEAVGIAIAVAEGLAAAHAKGITHRDLKPENIFLTEDARIKILDFGIAQMGPLLSDEAAGVESATSASAEAGMLIGTVSYMSPEQAEGKKVDPRSDVFSFGSLLYEMLVGHRAFQGKTKLETLDAIRHQEPEALDKVSAAGLRPIVTRCLAKAPSSRFPSAHELLLELKKPRAERVPLARRKPVWAGAMALAIVLLALALLPQKWRAWLPNSGRRVTSLAVLPLNNLSNDPEQEYFADGMTEALIADLAEITSLRVISQTSVMQLKGTKKSLAEIAHQLNVDGVIEGSVLRSGDQVRITAELVDIATDRHLWARTYDRKVGDVLTLQGEVAREIAGEIRARITPQESGRLSRDRSVSRAALDAYLKGRFYWGQFKEESLTRSIESYQEAIKIDPAYAAAYAGLSESWTGLGWIGARPWEEVRGMAKDAALKAVSIDGTLSDGHAAVAVVALRDWDWKTAEVEDRKAIDLNPGYPTAHMSYGNILRYLGRAEESIAQAKRAVELDPLSALTNEVLADAYLCARRPDLAVAQCQGALELYPDDSRFHLILGWAYFYQGRYDSAVEAITRSLAVDGVDPALSPDLAYINAVTGKKEAAHKTLDLLLALAKQAPVDSGMIALIYTGLDQRQEALDYLEQAYRKHSSMMAWLKVDMRFDNLREEPRFQDLLRRVGLI
ncbi:MAG: protein kinase [Acidobacteriia bacterium]|nr:protein kinase [Terriglobia bacterium]